MYFTKKKLLYYKNSELELYEHQDNNETHGVSYSDTSLDSTSSSDSS